MWLQRFFLTFVQCQKKTQKDTCLAWKELIREILWTHSSFFVLLYTEESTLPCMRESGTPENLCLGDDEMILATLLAGTLVFEKYNQPYWKTLWFLYDSKNLTSHLLKNIYFSTRSKSVRFYVAIQSLLTARSLKRCILGMSQSLLANKEFCRNRMPNVLLTTPEKFFMSLVNRHTAIPDALRRGQWHPLYVRGWMNSSTWLL